MVAPDKLGIVDHSFVGADPGSLAEEVVGRQVSAELSQAGQGLANASRVEELLRLREAELAAIVASADDAIISKRLDGTITTWNQAAERLYGYTVAEIIGRPIATIVPEDRRAELAEIMARLKRGERIAHHETVRVHKDGTRIDVSISISPMYDPAGQVIGASKIARDIRERRALERQKQEFVEMVAHDLGSPLTVIKGYAQLLQRRRHDDDRAVNAILTEVGRMDRLLRDLREVTRLDAGHLELRLDPVDLAALVRDRIAQAALAAEARHRLRCEVPDTPVIGVWDYDRVEQVLTNLLDNALKYAPSGEVIVRLESGETEARVSVQDQGPGLTAEQLQRVFERYARLPETSASIAGTGLGLFISKRLIEAHGGRLWADSVPGQGTTFTFTLPIAPDTIASIGRPDEQPGMGAQ